MPQGAAKPLIFLRADSEEDPEDEPFVVIVRRRDELSRWLHNSSPNLQWIQVEGLMRDPEAWALAAQGSCNVPLDVVLSAPGNEFADLYRLVDVLAVREVRISMPATPGFFKALRLAASLGLSVRLLPGQPSTEEANELAAALDFYLHDPMVEAPIEFFHSVLAWMRGAETGSLWIIFEEDPAIFQRDANGSTKFAHTAQPRWEGPSPHDFVSRHLARLISEGGECASCSWQQLCQGYFKLPGREYSCDGVKQLFSTLREAADEIERDLATREAQSS